MTSHLPRHARAHGHTPDLLCCRGGDVGKAMGHVSLWQECAVLLSGAWVSASNFSNLHSPISLKMRFRTQNPNHQITRGWFLAVSPRLPVAATRKRGPNRSLCPPRCCYALRPCWRRQVPPGSRAVPPQYPPIAPAPRPTCTPCLPLKLLPLLPGPILRVQGPARVVSGDDLPVERAL